MPKSKSLHRSYSPRFNSLTSVLLAGALLTACAENRQSATTTQTTTAQTTATTAPMSQSAESVAGTPAAASHAANTATSTPSVATLGSQPLTSAVAGQTVAGRNMIVRVEADFQVPDVVKAATGIEQLARATGGFVVSNTINNSVVSETQHTYQNGKQLTITSYVRRAELKVRVPKDKLEGFLADLQQQIGFLRSSQFTAQDITFDIQKTALEEELNRLRSGELSKQVNTQGASELKAIEDKYLAQREAEYAALAEQQLRHQVDYSLVRLTFDQPAQNREVSGEDLNAAVRRQAPPFTERLALSLRQGWSNFGEFVLLLASFWPFLLGMTAIVTAWRAWRRRRQQRPPQRQQVKSGTSLPSQPPEAPQPKPRDDRGNTEQ